jgi:hypothetical protein
MYATAPCFPGMQPLPPYPEYRRQAIVDGKVDGRFQKTRFSPEEDARLSLIVATHGPSDWLRVASCMGSRNARQCRERWQNYLNPTLRNDSWTPEEDRMLQELFGRLGAKWNKIGQSFANRSDMALRNRWQVLARRTKKTTFRAGELTSDASTEESSDLTIVPISDAGQSQTAQNPIDLMESLEPAITTFSDLNEAWGLWF